MNEITMRKIRNPFAQKKDEGYNCFGCSPDNPIGLNMEFYTDGESIVSEWDPQNHFQGYVNVLHGGIQATLMDEIASWLVYALLDTAGVTANLNVNYLKPVYINGPIQIKARLKERGERKAIIKAEILNEKGIVCSEGEVEYFLFPNTIARRKYHYPGKQAFIDE